MSAAWDSVISDHGSGHGIRTHDLDLGKSDRERFALEFGPRREAVDWVWQRSSSLFEVVGSHHHVVRTGPGREAMNDGGWLSAFGAVSVEHLSNCAHGGRLTLDGFGDGRVQFLRGHGVE